MNVEEMIARADQKQPSTLLEKSTIPVPEILTDGDPTVLELEPEKDFVETRHIKNITSRALAYLKAGFPIHFSGPAGTGKTTLALHVARQLERPVVVLFGDEEFGTSDLIGGEHGVRRRKLVDNFIRTVLKTEEDVRSVWVDSRLTEACKNGFTLIYDEFNRSRPEANNVLLSILEENLLSLPEARQGEGYLQVHPNFKAIFTSNPEEYAGVHKTQDALLDRMVSIQIDFYDRDTEIAITQSRGSVSKGEARAIVDVVRGLRRLGSRHFAPTIRACIIIAKVTRLREARVSAKDRLFQEICMDVLTSAAAKPGVPRERQQKVARFVRSLIQKYCTGKGDRKKSYG